MLLRDFLHRRQQGWQIFNVAGVGRDGIEKRFPLIAVTLVTHVENLFQLRVVREHAVVEMSGELRACLHQQGNGGFNGSDGLSVEHERVLLM